MIALINGEFVETTEKEAFLFAVGLWGDKFIPRPRNGMISLPFEAVMRRRTEEIQKAIAKLRDQAGGDYEKVARTLLSTEGYERPEKESLADVLNKVGRLKISPQEASENPQILQALAA